MAEIGRDQKMARRALKLGHEWRNHGFNLLKHAAFVSRQANVEDRIRRLASLDVIPGAPREIDGKRNYRSGGQ